MQDINSYGNLESGLKFEVFGAANKEDFIKKSSNAVCKILNVESGNKNNSRFEKIDIGNDPEKTKCGEDNGSICDSAAFSCSDGVRIFYPDLQKGIVYYPSHSDYYIQKYETYKETIEKGSYDQDIIDSLKIEVTYP